MTDWMAGPRAMAQHKQQEQIIRAAMEKEGMEFLVEQPYQGDSELTGGGIDALRWNGKPVTAFIEFPAQPSDPVLLGLVIHPQDNGEYTVIRVSRRQQSQPWTGFSFVADLSWADVRRWIHEDMDF